MPADPARRYLVAGVWVDPLGAEAALAGIATADRDAALRALVQERIDRINGTLASYETIKQFHLMDGALTVADGLLTATLKVRRKRVYESFRPQFEALYP